MFTKCLSVHFCTSSNIIQYAHVLNLCRILLSNISPIGVFLTFSCGYLMHSWFGTSNRPVWRPGGVRNGGDRKISDEVPQYRKVMVESIRIPDNLSHVLMFVVQMQKMHVLQESFRFQAVLNYNIGLYWNCHTIESSTGTYHETSIHGVDHFVVTLRLFPRLPCWPGVSTSSEQALTSIIWIKKDLRQSRSQQWNTFSRGWSTTPLTTGGLDCTLDLTKWWRWVGNGFI